MGAVGVPSRLLSPLVGPAVGFAAFGADSAAAPGQLPIAGVQEVAGHLEAPPMRLFGVVGADVSASLSPRMHGLAFRETGLPYLFVPISVPDEAELDLLFGDGGESIFGPDMSLSGLAVTSPYKRRAFDAATLRSPRCERAEAANTLVFETHNLRADNTDIDGVVAPLRALDVPLEDVTAVVQGTGGAARGAAVGLDQAGARVLLRGRDPDRTAALAERLGVDHLAADEICDEPAILVNATPLGRCPDDPLPFVDEELMIAGAVVDMVYGDRTTALAAAAAESGIPLVDGRTMLAYQGFPQFAAFTTSVPPRRVMLDAVGARPL